MEQMTAAERIKADEACFFNALTAGYRDDPALRCHLQSVIMAYIEAISNDRAEEYLVRYRDLLEKMEQDFPEVSTMIH